MKVLAIGAHPDDIELGCGGTISRLSAEGNEIHSVIMTNGGKSSIPEEFNNNIGEERKKESQQALKTLGVDKINFLREKDLELTVSKTVKLLRDLDKHYKKVYVNHPSDKHPDHRALGEAAREVFEQEQLREYETPSTKPCFSPDKFVCVANKEDQKIKALKKHKTQMHKKYMKKSYWKSQLTYWGIKSGKDKAEAFVEGDLQ